MKKRAQRRRRSFFGTAFFTIAPQSCITRPPDKTGLGHPDNRSGPFTVPSCGLRVFYKGTVFRLCAPLQALTAALQDLIASAAYH